MIDPQKFVACLQGNDVDFFAGVPDSLLKELCACLDSILPAGQHVIAANEGGAVALALGYHFATRRIPLVYLQNSGLGISLIRCCHWPMPKSILFLCCLSLAGEENREVTTNLSIRNRGA